MKKILFTICTLLTVFGFTLVSCTEDPVSQKHTYTDEEIAYKHYLDSIRHVVPVDYLFTTEVAVPVNAGYGGVTVELCPDTVKLLELFQYTSVKELVYGLGKLSGGVQSDYDIKYYAINNSTNYEYPNPSTSDYFGHWFDKNGDVCTWGDNAMLYIQKNDTFSLKYTIGLYPDRSAIGDKYTIYQAMKLGDYRVGFKFNVTISSKPTIPATEMGRDTLKLTAAVNTDYSSVSADLDVAKATTAIGAAPTLTNLYGIDGDGFIELVSFTADNGFFFDSSANVCSWGADGCAIFISFDQANGKILVGQMAGGCTAGHVYYGKIGFVNNGKLYVVVVKYTATA
jgi:hypothetical protein